MASTLRPIRHEDRLSLVDHLDELRKRLIACIVVFLIAFGVCLWQDNAILDIMNRPLDNGASLLHKKQRAEERPARADGRVSGAGAQDGARVGEGVRRARRERGRGHRARQLHASSPPSSARSRSRCRPRRSDGR